MIAADVYGWLEAQALWPDVVFTVVGILVTGAMGWITLRLKRIHPFKLWREHVHEQKRIADALDTSKPGGLTDLVQTLNSKENP